MDGMQTLSFILSLSLSEGLFWAFVAFALGATLMTSILFYHWVRYNPSVVNTLLVMAVYTAGTIFLLMSAFGLLAQL